MLPPLKALQAFEATARLKSFSKAAEQLFVTQSAISHQVKLLEDFIGQPLLLRQNKSVELTQSGDMLYSVVTDCFMRLHSVTQHLLNQPPVQLKILAQTSIAVEWLAPRLELFKQQQPQLDTLLDMASMAHHADPEQYDIIVGTWPAPAGFVSQHLRTEFWYPVCSPAQFQLLQSNDAAELLQYPLYSSETGEDWQLWCQHQQLRSPAALQLRYVNLALLATKAVSSGSGFALSNDFIAGPALQNGQLIALRQFSYQLPWGQYQLHYKADSMQATAVALFTQWLTEQLQQPFTQNSLR
jgi:LysR family transcriptional regulator, glycine cleavage system transcriptional activator